MDLHTICSDGVGFALFDMDGTLFDGDLGETTFFMTLIADHLGIEAHNLSKEDVCRLDERGVAAQITELARYASYIAEGDHGAAYQLTTDYMERLSYTEVKRTCARAFAEFTDPTLTLAVASLHLSLFVRPSPLMLSYLRECKHSVLVSASPLSVVQAFVDLNTLEPEAIIASLPGRENLPYGEAKVRLAKARGIERPFIAFGNSEGDIEMLTWAQTGVFRVTEATPELVEIAKRSGWVMISK